MGAFTRSRSGRVAGPANLRAGPELDKPDAAQTSSLCGLSVSMYCVATCTRIWICRCQTTVLNTPVCMKPTTGSGNAGMCEKLHDRSRIRLRQKAGVCVCKRPKGLMSGDVGGQSYIHFLRVIQILSLPCCTELWWSYRLVIRCVVIPDVYGLYLVFLHVRRRSLDCEVIFQVAAAF